MLSGFDTAAVPGQPWQMDDPRVPSGDSPENSAALRIDGGAIPGAPGTPAFSLNAPRPSAVPVLIAVPHAGRAYPGSLLERMRNPGFAALKLEDRYVDRLAERVAAQTGAALLVAHAPRAMIDLNRAIEDIDWDMFARGKPDRVGVAEEVVQIFAGNGFTVWGGTWDDPLDFQHFDIGRALADELVKLPPDAARARFEQSITQSGK